MSKIRWARVNDEPLEYAIQQGPHGDEFVKLLDGSCLRREPDEIERLRAVLEKIASLSFENEFRIAQFAQEALRGHQQNGDDK